MFNTLNLNIFGFIFISILTSIYKYKKIIEIASFEIIKILVNIKKRVNSQKELNDGKNSVKGHTVYPCQRDQQVL